jgi:thiol-disulfide isomerase/thioredoxin
MTLLGGLVVLAVLVGILWLLWHTLQHQGRLLLRIEAVESRLGQAGLSAQGADAIRGLVASAIGLPMLRSLPRAAPAQHNGNGAQPKPRPITPAIGEPAPEFSLPSLEGNQIKLSDFRGHKTLVLFWRPGCGFCQRMLPDLQAWEKRPPQDAPGLLVVSSESVESNRAMKLRSPVVLDQPGMSVGSQFGATGTPMAILVDEEGKIASALAAGAPPVLALMRGVQDTTARV